MPIIVNFGPGDAVVQKLKPFTGTVAQPTQDNPEVVKIIGAVPHYLVDYTDPETGDTDQRWFTDAEIVAGQQAAPAPAQPAQG